MNNETVIPVLEETTSLLGGESLNDIKKKRRYDTFIIILNWVCFAYVVWFIASIDPEKIGRSTSIDIFGRYILPAIISFTILLSMMKIIPFILFYFLSTPGSDCPAERNIIRDNVPNLLILAVFSDFCDCISLIGPYIVIIETISYFYFYFYKSSLIENLTQTPLAVSYLAALFFSKTIWMNSIVATYKSIVCTIEIWKIVIIEIRHIRNLK